MEIDKTEPDDMTKEEIVNSSKQEITPNHALGLQDLYKAAFSQEIPDEFNEFQNKSSSFISTNLLQESNEKYLCDGIKLEQKTELEQSDDNFKNSIFDETYQLHTLKGLQYSIDFVKPQNNSLELSHLSYEVPKVNKSENSEVLSSASVLNRFYESFPNEPNSVLDLDKGVQVHLVKDESTIETPSESSLLAYRYETCEYTGDAQILHRYLSDSAFAKEGNTGSNLPLGTVTVNFVNKENSDSVIKNFCDNNTVGVNPETLGVRFEDCDFNSSDSFASTESIIPKNINCPKCPKKFMFKSDLLRHDKYKHSVKPKLFCKFCNKEFVSQQNLLFHEKSHKKKKSSYKCEICKKVFKKSAVLVQHMMKKHSKDLPFSCTQCGKVFPTQILLNNHVRKAHMTDNEKPYKCDICSKSFEKKQGLSCHAKAHLEEQPYICQYCNKSFSKVCYLKNHLKSHKSEEKDCFACDTCGKEFKSSSALEEHSRKHTGEKPFTCSVCMKSFAYKAYFKIHIKKHAKVKPFTCTQCSKSFVTMLDLNKHEKSHAKEKIYVCANCNLDFSQESQLVAHWKKQKCKGNNSLEIYTQTADLGDSSLQNVTLQNVNVIVDQAFAGQQPIVLTSLGSFINSNSVPVILTPNPSGPYSVSSIT